MDPGLPQWLTGVGVIGTLGTVLGLWLKGVLVRAKDCDERIKALTSAHDVEVALIHDGHANQLTALNLAHDNARRRLEDQVASEQADRAAWHAAYSEEAGARRAAEHATAQLMESSNVIATLLSTLRSAIAPREDP